MLASQPVLAALAGLLLLMGGGNYVVRQGTTLAQRLGVPPLFIGVVIVGFGTSAPELATGVRAALSGAPALAFGNVIGASLANLLIVLPLAALLLPFRISRIAIASEGAAVAAAAAVFAGLAFLPALARASGVVLLLLLALWLFVSLRHSTRSRAAEAALQKREAMVVAVTAPWWEALFLLLAGILALVLGADLLVGGATRLAVRLGVGEDVLGLTLLSFGTCLPELATAIAATRRRQTDIVIGNVLGSCLFNILAVGGLVMAISGTVPQAAARRLDAPVLAAAALFVIALLMLRERVGRPAALLLLALYVLWLTVRL